MELLEALRGNTAAVQGFKARVLPFGAILAALAVGAVLLLSLRVNPLVAYGQMVLGALGSLSGLTETLVKTTPLLLAGLSVALAFNCGLWNIGAEGQLYVGALATVGIGINQLHLPSLILLPLAIILGFFIAGLWGAIAGLLKVRLQANEVIVTIMMNYIAILGASYLVNGPWATGIYPITKSIEASARLPVLLPGTRLHAGFLIALAAAILLYLLIFRTRVGYEIRAMGHNLDAARYAGMRVNRNVVTAMGISGGLAGLAGVGEVAGIHHAMMENISPGYGYTAILVALLGKLHPLWIILSSFLFSALYVGADAMQRAVGIPTAMVWVIQGLLVLFILGSRLLRRYGGFSN
ncbi:MAG: ABC transporter permease [Nitrospinota bacterium]